MQCIKNVIPFTSSTCQLQQVAASLPSTELCIHLLRVEPNTRMRKLPSFLSFWFSARLRRMYILIQDLRKTREKLLFYFALTVMEVTIKCRLLSENLRYRDVSRI
jgi:hypothetical protein